MGVGTFVCVCVCVCVGGDRVKTAEKDGLNTPVSSVIYAPLTVSPCLTASPSLSPSPSACYRQNSTAAGSISSVTFVKPL